MWWWTGHGFTGGIMMLFVWVIIIWGIFFVGRRIAWGHRDAEISRESSKSALDILEERYASGEIDKETFLQMKEDIMRR